MKALIISDDENFTVNCSSFFENNKYDVITYKWLLKALDNIEEIKPDVIVLSAAEYPRHWKTLVQFVKSGIGSNDTKIYLYEPSPLSSDEQEKAKILGINGSFCSVDELDSLFDDNEVPQVSEILNQTEEESASGQIIVNNPATGAFVFGTINSKNGDILSCVFDFDLSLSNDSVFSKITYLWNNTMYSAKATVQNISDKTIELKVTDYEEK